MKNAVDISVRGRRKTVPAVRVGDVAVVSKGGLLRIGEIFDEYWLQRAKLPSYEVLIEELRSRKERPDIFTFAQRVPDVIPAFNYYRELDNYAVLPISTYDEWLKKIPPATRRNIRASTKRGVAIREAVYDDDYVKGIVSIYNETPIRAGRKFWHYGKDFETVRKENGTFAERSTFLAAYIEDEMVGYLKIVWDASTASIMQILSKVCVRQYRPNNALMAEAVKQCCRRSVGYLLYEKFEYNKKVGEPLTRFKQTNGFSRMDIPRYYVPLTRKGALALRFGFHKHYSERIPDWIGSPLRNLRTKWYERHAPGPSVQR